MTIIIAVNINEGIVLGSDSAATIVNENKELKFFYKRTKIFNYLSEIPIGIAIYGDNEIENVPLSSLIKEHEKYLKKDSNLNNYKIKDIIENFRDSLSNKSNITDETIKKRKFFGFLIAGYSSYELLPEIWELEFKNGVSRIKQQSNIVCKGECDPTHRLYFGYDPQLKTILERNNIDQNTINKILLSCGKQISLGMIHANLPILDAIDFVKYLIQITIDFYRFRPVTSYVGGDIDLAKITKYQGFEWIQSKQ